MQRHAGHAAWDEADGQALIRRLMQSTRQFAVAFLDEGGHFTGWSEGCHAISGFTAQDVLGNSFGLLFTPEDVALDLHSHELNSARLLGAAEDERWHLRKDGSRFWGAGVTLRLDPEPGTRARSPGFAKLFRDATHLRLRMDALENELAQMRKDRREHAEFLAIIAHELRNPLHSMSIATELLEMAAQPGRDEQALKILHRQLGSLERLAEDLVDMTRLGFEKMSVNYATVPFQELLQDAVQACQDAAHAKELTLACVVPPLTIMVEVDPERMQQVLVNLLNNAIKFTPPGGRVAVLGNVDATHFTVKVQDTGQGIAAELQPRIFDMFTQAQSANTSRGRGLGIGLALVKQIVSLHRGSVEVRSEGTGKGSEFFIRVPLLRPALERSAVLESWA